MYNHNSYLGLITARGGSKRIPGKNLKMIAGKPLMAWTVEAGLQSEFLDGVMVSTECNSIAACARNYGASVPFLRPDELSADTSSSMDVIIHALENLKRIGQSYDYIVLLQPTSPLRQAEDIDGAIRFLSEKQKKAVISVCRVEHLVQWSNTLPPDLSMDNFIPEKYLKRSQELEPYYRINGAIYIASVEQLLAEKTFFLQNDCIAYIMDRMKSVDIDDVADFEYAEYLLKKK